MNGEKLDSITAEVVGNALQSITEEMGAALVRSAYSTNIKERRDCSCAIFAQDGSLVALAEHIPIHLGSMQGLLGEIAQNLQAWELHSGDVIIANDPYRGGGSHLPDVTVVQPVFYQDELAVFVANIAHWTDVGGRSPGVGTAGDSTEIFQEGLRIPPTRIVSRGEVSQKILDLLLVNMRGREERLGDFRAQIASLNLGRQRILELFKRYGSGTIAACITETLDYSERWLRRALSEIPAGTYHFEDAMDDDGVSDERLSIKVAITISPDDQSPIAFDFTGTAPQTLGGINMVWAALLASVYYAVKAIIAPEVPLNAGFQRPIHIYAPEGSLVNAKEPAAVGGRTDTCQRVVDAIMGALSSPLPRRVVAASNGATTAIIFSGTKALSGREFIYVEALGGGLGARYCKDGTDGVQVHITNTSNLPIEVLELEYPLRVLCYELVPDSGGPGKFRGGLAIRRDIQALIPVLFSSHSDRHLIPPWGLMGGLSGACGRFLRNPNRPSEKPIRSKISEVFIGKGDIISVQTAGGGGFGSPLEREPDQVKHDCSQGKISRRQAELSYGVIFDSEGNVVHSATTTLREKLRLGRDS
ncbi:MAG: hydantoinase B/oxoprolinase family protein [Candidatus Heimdallarchaeota archaeon]